jgi:uncharacterized protein YegL
MTTVPLILKSETVSKIDLGGRKARLPFVAVVYATADGELVVIDGGKPMTRSEQIFAPYKYRYEVDLSDHGHTIEIQSSPLPAMGGIHHFRAQLAIGFRVVDPAEIVRRRVTDGLGLVSSYIIDTCRQITLNYRFSEFAAAEQAINNRFAHGAQLAEGIELYACRARLSLDNHGYGFLSRSQFAEQDNIAKRVEHQTRVEDTTRDAQLSQLRQLADLNARALEQQALAGRPLDMRELIAIHLERNPQDTERAIQWLAAHEKDRLDRGDKDREHQTDMVKFLVGKDLIQAVDVKAVRDQALGGITAGTAATEPAGGAAWDDPPPSSGARFTAGAAGAAAVPGLLPVYLVLDASYPLRPYATQLNDGIRMLYERLWAAPELAAVLRLAVVGYSDEIQLDPTPRLIAATGPVPLLNTYGEPRYGPAFQQLVSSLPRDVEQLKTLGPAVRRPQVLFLSGAQATDTPAWQATHRTLVDRETQRYAPEIAAFGIAAAIPEAITSIATRPELAYIATDPDTGRAITAFFAFAADHLLRTARAVIDGEEAAPGAPPAPFTPAR